MKLPSCLFIKLLHINSSPPPPFLSFLSYLLPSFLSSFHQLVLSCMGVKDVKWCYSTWWRLWKECRDVYKAVQTEKEVLSSAGSQGVCCKELLLGEYSRCVRMRSRKMAKTLASSEEFPAASLSPTLNPGLCQRGTGTAPRDHHSEGPLSPVRGKEDTAMSVSNCRNSHSRSQLSLPAS